MQNKVTILDTDKISISDTHGSLYAARCNGRNALGKVGEKINSDITLIVNAYNRLEKTKQCLESLYENTKNIPYYLILLDNGSTDGTFEYFKEFPYENKWVIKVTKNIGSGFGFQYVYNHVVTKYIAGIPNDIIFTPNWLDNLVTCMESDERIGLVVPCSSNVSNLQEVSLPYKNHEEMMEVAYHFNQSNPCRWLERLRLVTPLVFIKKECFDIIGTPIDYGFIHDFVDDDLSFRVRRAGYKCICCFDTWVHHNHDFRNFENKDPREYQKSLQLGKKDFSDKYFGVDAWDDVNNYECSLFRLFNPHTDNNVKKILGVDTRCGTPILEAKNKYRLNNAFNTECSSFVENAKYFIDLKTICNGEVVCDRINFISEYFSADQFDCIILGKELNLYSEALDVLKNLICFLKRNGQLLIKLRNTNDILSFLYTVKRLRGKEEYPICWNIESLEEWIGNLGGKVVNVSAEGHDFSPTDRKNVEKAISTCKLSEERKQSLMIKNYLISITK